MKNKKILYVLICIIILLLYAGLIKDYWTPEPDSAYFISIARSISRGDGFTHLGYTVHKVPPGFPLMLVPIILLKGINFLYMNILIILCALASFLVIYFLFRINFSKDYSILIMAFSAISILMVSRSLYIMSDIPYLLFSMLGLLLAEKSLRKQPTIKYEIVAGIFVALSFALRTTGFGLLIAYLLYLLISKNVDLRLKRITLVLITVAIIIVSLKVSIRGGEKLRDENLAHLGEFVSYKEELLRIEFDEPFTRVNPKSFATRLIKNSVYYAGSMSNEIIGKPWLLSREVLTFKKPFIQNLPLLLTLAAIALIILIGFYVDFRRGPYIFSFYFMCYLGIQVLLSARETRYLVGVLPFIFHYFFTGINFVSKKIPVLSNKKIAAPVSVLFLLLLGSLNIYHDFSLLKSVHGIPGYWPDYGNQQNVKNFMTVIRWIKEELPQESRIISDMAPWVVLFSEKWCISFPKTDKQEIIVEFIKRTGADHIIVAPLHEEKYVYLTPVIEAQPTAFSLLYESGQARIYRINQEVLK